MPFVVAGLMMVAYSLMIRSDFIARGQAHLFRLDGDAADRRRTQVQRTSQVTLALGLVVLIVGAVWVAVGT